MTWVYIKNLQHYILILKFKNKVFINATKNIENDPSYQNKFDKA